MSNIDCIIIEDEPLAVKVLQDYISAVSFLKLRGCFKDAIDAIKYLRDHEPDLIFLDIHLPKLKGMDFLRTLESVPDVIITTAYHQYALEGYELNVTDYLMKPIEFDRFLLAVNRVKTHKDGVADQSRSSLDAGGKDYLFLSVQKKKVKVLLSDILYVESQREYVKVVTLDKVHMPKMTTMEMERLLPDDQFRRIHRSYIVALDKIEAYTSEHVEVGGKRIPVGRNYRSAMEGFVK